MSVRPLTVIDTGYRKITKAVTDFDQAKDKKLKARAKDAIKPALKDYINDLVIFMSRNEIVDDPFGVIYCDNFKHDFMIYDATFALYDLREENEDMKTAIDNIMCHAVETGKMNQWAIKYRKGAYAVITNKTVVLVVDGVKTAMQWTKDTFNGIVAWIMEKFSQMFSSKKAEPVPA